MILYSVKFCMFQWKRLRSFLHYNGKHYPVQIREKKGPEVFQYSDDFHAVNPKKNLCTKCNYHDSFSFKKFQLLKASKKNC